MSYLLQSETVIQSQRNELKDMNTRLDALPLLILPPVVSNSDNMTSNITSTNNISNTYTTSSNSSNNHPFHTTTTPHKELNIQSNSTDKKHATTSGPSKIITPLATESPFTPPHMPAFSGNSATDWLFATPTTTTAAASSSSAFTTPLRSPTAIPHYQKDIENTVDIYNTYNYSNNYTEHHSNTGIHSTHRVPQSNESNPPLNIPNKEKEISADIPPKAINMSLTNHFHLARRDTSTTAAISTSSSDERLQKSLPKNINNKIFSDNNNSNNSNISQTHFPDFTNISNMNTSPQNSSHTGSQSFDIYSKDSLVKAECTQYSSRSNFPTHFTQPQPRLKDFDSNLLQTQREMMQIKDSSNNINNSSNYNNNENYDDNSSHITYSDSDRYILKRFAASNKGHVQIPATKGTNIVTSDPFTTSAKNIISPYEDKSPSNKATINDYNIMPTTRVPLPHPETAPTHPFHSQKQKAQREETLHSRPSYDARNGSY